MEKILIIDDNIDFIEYMRFINAKYRFNMSFSTNPSKALKRSDLMLFEKIIVDLHMTPINGEDFIKEYKKIGGKAKIILCTSFITEGDDFLGADDGLRKPFSIEEFKQKLNIN